jgi:segregation and condensation protein A
MNGIFQVELDSYCGPLDLLLYLVRREELDISSLTLVKVTEQFFSFLDAIGTLQLDDIADFIEVASILLELKGKYLMPKSEAEGTAAGVIPEPSVSDPADELVQRLLAYKKIREATSILDEQSQKCQLRYSRMANDLPVRKQEISEQPIAEVEIWDLVSAFGRILREKQPLQQATVIYDETPIQVYMKRIHQDIKEGGRRDISDYFQPGMHKSALVGMFLATLELTRHYGLEAKQESELGPLWLGKGERFTDEIEVAEVDSVVAEMVKRSNLPYAPR